MKIACRLMAASLAVSMMVPPAAFAQSQGGVSGTDLQELQARMEEQQQLATIEADKAGYVGELLARFASMGGVQSNETFMTKGTRRLMKKSAHQLRQLSGAKDFDTFIKLAYEGYTIDSFGQLTRDLVFFPINACRIYDSRTATAVGLGGPMAPGTQRDISVNDSTSLQGGSATACDTLNPDLVNDPPALAITLTAASPTGPGNLRTFPKGAAVPLAAMLTYSTGTTISTGTVTASNSTTLESNELTVRNQGAGNTDVVIDIVGYFHAPVEQGLTCTQQTASLSPASGAFFSFSSPTCPAGTTLTGGGANWTITGNTDLWWWQNSPNGANTAWTCRGNNQTGGSPTIVCTAICCSIPGR
jgi:hypothetical protein